jgi:hypothetical protein
MNAKLLIAVVASSLFPLAANAQDCSGGADGGMDATGNQCNREIAALATPSDRAMTTPTRSTKPGASRPASCTKCAVNGETARRTASVHPRVKHGR